MISFDINRFDKIDIEHAQTPNDGEVVQIHRNDYWFVYKDRWILTNKQGGPMCNSNLEIIKRSYLFYVEDIEVRRLDTVYIPWDTAEYS